MPTLFSAKIEAVDQTPIPLTRPTPRQLEAIGLCARGMTYVEIGREMIISQWTVKDVLDNLRERICARNTPHAIAICVVNGWLAVVDGDLVVIGLQDSISESALAAA